MSGKISNHNEMADGVVKLKDNKHETSVVEDISADVKKKSGIKEDKKLVNGIVKDDFEKSNNNYEKETSTNASKTHVESVSADAKIENGFNSSSESSKENPETPSGDELNDDKRNSEPNGLTNKSIDKNENTEIVPHNIPIQVYQNNEEKLENVIDSIEQKDDKQRENITSTSCNNETSNKDSKASSDSTLNIAETNKKEEHNDKTVKMETDKINCEKRSQNAKEDDENNDVIIIGSTEGVCKSSKENNDATQKFDAKNATQKLNKSQTGGAQAVKSEAQSSVSMSSASSSSLSSSNAPSLGDTSMTAFARLLHDLGVELVRQHVYKDLVEIQVSKDAQNKLNEREKEQLAKLEEFYAKQEIRNAPYNLKEYTARCKCRVFASESRNVMRLHQEYGRIESGSVHVCCCCKEFKSRWPSHYITHMKADHGMVGRLRKKMSPYRCSFCSYEAKNQLKIDTHMITCSKRFVLACNLQPLPADTDIPLKRRFIQTISYTSSQSRYSNYLANSSTNSSGYTSIYNHNNSSFQSYYNQNNNRTLSDPNNRSLYNNMSNNNNSILSQQQQQAAKDVRSAGAKMEICEICGSNIFSRAALLNHLQIMHKVKLNTVRGSTEPIMSCDRCPARFWTYQGLAKHATMVHKSSATSSMLSNSGNTNCQSSVHANVNRVPPVCHICGDSQTFNPLNHMSTRHNITLLDMYQVKQCYICNKALKNGPNFQEHMVLYHRDIFANKDVLHTVLQALSAARHLKREESSQPQSSPNFNKYKKSNQPLTSTPISSQKSGMFAPGGLSGSGGSRSAPIKRRTSQATPCHVTKPPEKEKKTSEQERIEMEKLYENLAGIGRPILRSMKQRMSSGPSTNTTSTSPSTSTPSNKPAPSTPTNTHSSPSTHSPSTPSIPASKKSDSSKPANSSNLNNNNNNNNFKNNPNINNNNYNNPGNKNAANILNHSNNNYNTKTNNNSNNNYNSNNQSNAYNTKSVSVDKNVTQDLKTTKVQQQQQQQPSSSSSSSFSTAPTEPEAKRQRLDESVVVSDSN